MLTVAQAAKRAGVCPAVVYAWVAGKVLAHLRVGRPGTRGAIRVLEADLDAYLASLRVEPRAEPASVPVTAKPKRSGSFRHLNV
jgi:excisionase family DNA binding protein